MTEKAREERETKRKRLEAALRENLRRRKAQARGREEAERTEPPEPKDRS
jgi:hypothetical protein